MLLGSTHQVAPTNTNASVVGLSSDLHAKNTMNTLTYARWEPPIPTNLPEVEGHIVDLLSAIDFAAELDAAYLSKPWNYTVLDALCTALIVRYSRLFTQGVRAPFKLDTVAGLADEHLALHERVLAIRNKHVAHPVNRLETQSVYVGFDLEAGDKARVTAVSSGTRTQIALCHKEVQLLQGLCMRLYEFLRTQQVAECEHLMHEAQTLSPEQLVALPRGPVDPDLNPRRGRA